MKINEIVESWWNRTEAEKMAIKYTPGFMDKWENELGRYERAGRSPDVNIRKKVLNTLINQYTKPSPKDQEILNKMIDDAGNKISNDKTIRNIAYQAIVLAINKRPKAGQQAPQQQQQQPASKGQPAQADWANQRKAAWDKTHGTKWASKRNANWKTGQVTQRAPQQQTQQKPAAPTTGTEIPNGTTVPYNNTQYKWVNNAWRDVNTGEVLTGKDAEAATYNYRNPE